MAEAVEKLKVTMPGLCVFAPLRETFSTWFLAAKAQKTAKGAKERQQIRSPTARLSHRLFAAYTQLMNPGLRTRVLIQRAVSADALAISDVLRKAFAEYKSLYTVEGFAATTPNPSEVLARMSEGPIWIALLNTEVVGTVAAVKKVDSLYMRGMGVLPSARGGRVGGSLLNEVFNYASGETCRRIFLSTTPFLHRAIRLYEKFGFTRCDEGPFDLYGTPLFSMEKVL